MNAVKPGEIYFAHWGGSGQDRHRLIIVSDERYNRGDYVTIVPVTSEHFEKRAKLSNCVAFNKGAFGFAKDCVAQAEQIATIRKTDLDLPAGPISVLSPGKMKEMVRAIGVVIAADCSPSPDTR